MKAPWGPRTFRHYPLFVELEARCLLAGIPAVFDAPWRGFDTGAFEEVFAPNSIAVGDMDGDRLPDMVIGNGYFGHPGISILRNLGGGTFAPPSVYALEINQTVGEATVADIDLDGKPDVLATIPDVNGQTKKLFYWRNNGDGTLAPRKEFTTGTGPLGLAVADFTGDSFPDVVTANFAGFGAGTTVSLLPHNGQTGAAAGFRAPITITVGGGPQRVVAGDLNGDGKPDLAIGRSGAGFGTLTVLLNAGGGVFGAPTNYEAAPGAVSYTPAVELSDIDKDGDLDLLGGGYIGGSIQSGAVTIRRNAGDGTFGAAQRFVLKNSTAPPDLAVADLSGDSYPDVITISSNGLLADGWSALLNSGAGRFRSSIHLEASEMPAAVAAADADADGDQDVLVLAKSSAAVTVHTNPGQGKFSVLQRYDVGTLSEALDAADIDLDGDTDLVTSDDQVRILLNPGDGVFEPYQTYPPPINPADVKLRDLNGDAYPDLLLGPDAEYPPYHFGSALNNGDGTFAPGTVTSVDSCGDGTIDAFDLDNDGDLDVALTEEGGCIGGDPLRLFVYRNNGSGTFTLATILFPPGGAKGIAGADINHDGNVDLITAVVGGMAVYPGNGDLTFAPPIISGDRTNAPSLYFTLTDLNEDGNHDLGLIAAQGSFGTVLIGVKLGDGEGTFGPTVFYTGSSVLQSGFLVSNTIKSADVNLDGKADLVVFNNASNDISLFLGNGDGTLDVHQRYGTGDSPWRGAIADFTGDGIPDVVTKIGLPPGGTGNAVVLLRGLAPSPQPAPGVDLPFLAIESKDSAYGGEYGADSVPGNSVTSFELPAPTEPGSVFGLVRRRVPGKPGATWLPVSAPPWHIDMFSPHTTEVIR